MPSSSPLQDDIAGAEIVHGLTIDYLGLWNERSYSADWTKALRAGLDAARMQHVKIVAADDGSSLQLSQMLYRPHCIIFPTSFSHPFPKPLASCSSSPPLVAAASHSCHRGLGHLRLIGCRPVLCSGGGRHRVPLSNHVA